MIPRKMEGDVPWSLATGFFRWVGLLGSKVMMMMMMVVSPTYGFPEIRGFSLTKPIIWGEFTRVFGRYHLTRMMRVILLKR